MPRFRFPTPPNSEITPEANYLNRRQWMQKTAGGVAGSMAALGSVGGALGAQAAESKDFEALKSELGESVTPVAYATGYNNFYEFGTDKTDPAEYAHELTLAPWKVEIAGEVDKPGIYDLDDLLRGCDVEDRVYRHRCVEAWSMVIPWRGVPLATLIKKFGPTSKAKYVRFTTVERPAEMRGQRSVFTSIDWPYVEGLRIDEAMNPLTLMATGMYGKSLPPQNGAPLRLVTPWKYGFKGIKSIVKIEFTERQPRTTWVKLGPSEYGFYANVNPAVNHPRWSQASERRLPSTLFNPNRIDTMPFNGYGEQVAALYAGMDLRRNF